MNWVLIGLILGSTILSLLVMEDDLSLACAGGVVLIVTCLFLWFGCEVSDPLPPDSHGKICKISRCELT